MNEITFVLLTNLLLLLAVALFFIHSWLPMLRPDWYYFFYILSNNLLDIKLFKIFIPFEGNKESYEKEKCVYDKTDSKPYLIGGVYSWFFEKGKSKPIGFIQNTNTDGELISTFKKQAPKIIDDIIAGEPTIEDFIKTWGVIIIGVILIIAILYMINRSDESTKLLLNATLSRN